LPPEHRNHEFNNLAEAMGRLDYTKARLTLLALAANMRIEIV
jgi:hypothetical protein